MENIAIIGVGCRFPSAENLESFWHLLSNGADAITEVPPERWNVNAFYAPEPATPGKMNTRCGGFLKQVDRFDASFFGIAPREVERMDPQQRLFLEVAWEALENAGLAPDKLTGSQTGVYVGVASVNYAQHLFEGANNISRINAYDGIGNVMSLTASRLSYLLNLKGPSMAVETACSSSLVAIHLACQSLQRGESDLSVVGGVNMTLSPELTIAFSQAQMMAADGRCKTFDASADGYVRGEGCGVVILKRLSDAQKDGDNILALIRGSAVNQDGLSNGITAPNGPSQQAVIRQALKNAKVAPAQISYVETHGTGTPLGDPIEVKSIKEVLMQGRKADQHCWIGSVKTNIGHLEAAAGIAGLIKVVLSLQHQEIPPHLHLKELNPYIRINNTPFSIPTELKKWSVKEGNRLAGVSSFGFGGTNAHVILEEAPLEIQNLEKEELSERPLHIFTLSAKSAKALRELAKSYENFLTSHCGTSLANICFTANTGRSHFNQRLAITAESTIELRDRLSAFVAGKETSGLIYDQVQEHPKIAFLFTGQGSQYLGMGHELYQTQPVFRAALDRCAEILQPYLKEPLLEVIYPNSSHNQRVTINDTAYTQPVLFAFEYSLFELWKSWGIKPSVVMGHSIGEYVAACVAGVFSLEDGLKLIAARGRLMQSLPQEGEMVAVLASESQVLQAIEPYSSKIAIAAINGSQNTVISGDRSSVRAVVSSLKAERVKTKSLQVSHAFHSSLMKPMLAEFEQVARTITYSLPQLSLISNLTGETTTAEIATPDYWCRHILQPVKFADSMKTLVCQNYRVFLEIGPKPTLLGMGRLCLPEAEVENFLLLPSLRPGRTDWQQILESLAQLYARGVIVDWAGFERHYSRRRVILPNYPFQRQRYWIANAKKEDNWTPLLNLLHEANIEQVISQLKMSEKLLEDEIKLLPKLLKLIAEKHQQQLALPSKLDINRTAAFTEPSSPDVVLKEVDWCLELLALETKERRGLLESYFNQLLAKVMGFSADELNKEVHLSSLGLDSLMATELRRLIQTDLKIEVPVEFFGDLNIKQFSTQLLFIINKKYPIEQQQQENSINDSHQSLTGSIMASTPYDSNWFNRPKVNPQARFRLFCFSYAGASASIFSSWTDYMPSDIEICSLQLPGREKRIREAPFTRLKPLIQTLATLLKPYTDIPFAFFGHSLGAQVSFELARELRRRNWSIPSHLFVSASRAPQLPDLESPIHRLPNPEFIEKLKQFQGIPELILQNLETMELFLPALRADFEILETYFYTNEEPLECPISAFGGLEDQKISYEELAAWRKQTCADFNLQFFPGDHFFLHAQKVDLVQTIVKQTQQLLVLNSTADK
jgi:acyl transferase domain-containing protein/surfactin synthase thioesterase subunit/acyl carrier protein